MRLEIYVHQNKIWFEKTGNVGWHQLITKKPSENLEKYYIGFSNGTLLTAEYYLQYGWNLNVLRKGQGEVALRINEKNPDYRDTAVIDAPLTWYICGTREHMELTDNRTTPW